MADDPISLFRSVTEALQHGDWSAAASLCDPAALARFREDLIARFEPSEPVRPLTVEEYVRHSPDTPPEVAEHFVRQINRDRDDPAARLGDELAGVESVDALRAMEPAAVFAAWLEARSPRHQLDRMVAAGQVPAEASDMLGQFAMRHVAVGAVADGERVSHVVFRVQFDPPMPEAGGPVDAQGEGAAGTEPGDGGAAAEEAYVATCRKQADGTWRMVPGTDFLRFAGMSVCVTEEGG